MTIWSMNASKAASADRALARERRARIADYPRPS